MGRARDTVNSRRRGIRLTAGYASRTKLSHSMAPQSIRIRITVAGEWLVNPHCFLAIPLRLGNS